MCPFCAFWEHSCLLFKGRKTKISKCPDPSPITPRDKITREWKPLTPIIQNVHIIPARPQPYIMMIMHKYVQICITDAYICIQIIVLCIYVCVLCILIHIFACVMHLFNKILIKYAYLYRSEGFPFTCYFIPVRDGAGVWTFGNLRLPAFKQEAIIFLKLTKRKHFITKVYLLVTISTFFAVLTPYM